MSRHHIEKVTCPSCHHEGDFELWDSINTALDPEMKEKVLNQSIFLYTCPSCGETFRLNYSTLYHQMEDLVMIYLVPESEVKKTYEIFYEKNALADYRTEKYLYRIVTSANQLVEKIQIFDAGKDDRVMELVKLLATDSILKNDPDEGEKARNYIVFDELNMVDEVKGAEFAIMSPVGYSGRNRTAKNARWLYGIAVDLDGVEMEQLRDVFHQMKHDFLPQCTYCVNSGHGLHLYYLFEKPVPLYRHLQDQLREFKYELIRKIWNRYTSTYTEREQVQYQGIFQGFRMVGTQSKLGKRYPVTAFETGERVTVEYLNDFLMDDSKAVTDFKYKSDLSLAEAKKKYPEWYEKRIVRGEKKGRWHIKRDLYDWWLRKIQSGAVSVGHRYWCLSVLASYGIKCDIPEDEVLTDALELLPMFDDISDDEHNRFTKRDVLDAMNMYQENYVTYSRAEVERVSGISVPPNKRNGRKQDKHLQLARGIRELKSSMGEAVSGGGRPDKAKIVEEWRKSHPDGKKADCIRDTGLSKPTVYRWWSVGEAL